VGTDGNWKTAAKGRMALYSLEEIRKQQER
jgi:hypothetical protein